jgi:O-antigen ligase
VFLKNVLDSDRLEKIRIFLLSSFAFCLPLNQKWSTLILLALVAILLLMKKEKVIFWNLTFLLPPLLYLVIVASLFYSDQFEFRYLEQRASLIAFPIIFSAARLIKEDRIKVFKYFVWGCALAILMCYLNAFYNSISIVNGSVIFKPVVNDQFSFMYSVVRDGNYFFSSWFSLFHQTTYFALYLNASIAIILAFSLWKKNKANYFFLLLFPMVIFQLSSKIGLIICGMIFMIYGLSKLQKIVYKGLFVTVFLAIGTLFILKNPRVKIMTETLMERGITIEPSERYGYSLRLMSWDAALTVFYKNPIIGVGVGDTQAELNQVYANKGYIQPLKEKLNAHNQFLQTMLVGGSIGLIVLLGILWSIFHKVRTSKFNNYKFFNTLFLIMITLSFMLESVLNRYSGISFFFFFYYLIITQEQYKSIVNGN